MKEQRESLESLLSKTPHIDDDGFTEALMTRLAPGRPSLRMRTIILLTSTVASCSVVAAVPGARRFLAELSIAFVSGSAATGSNLVTVGIAVALLVWGAMARDRSGTAGSHLVTEARRYHSHHTTRVCVLEV